MLEIYGDKGEPEFEAAQCLERLLVDAWGSLSGREQKVSIITAAQCPGQKVQDIDLLLLVRLKPELPVRIPNAIALGLVSDVHVKSLCVTIEVKSHPPESVQFTQNGGVRVRYLAHWHDASNQSMKQKYALKGYLEIFPDSPVPFIAGVVWLRGVLQKDLPAGIHNLVGSDATWPDFVVAILSQQHSRFQDGFEILNSERNFGDITRVRNIFAKPLQPSTLDRRKIEAIVGESMALELESLPSGRKQVVYRGRGGTGKTVALLHVAYDRYVRFQQRTLFLTYNVVLAAEVERLLTIRGVRDQVGGRSIRVETIQSFIGKVLRATGLLKDDEDFVSVYADRKQQLMKEYLNDPLLICAVREESDLLAWDLVCIDEAQDCPVDERDILHVLFGPERCVIADGIDQMVRRTDPCDWQPTPAIKSLTEHQYLKKSLRLQHGLCNFANAVAQGLGLDNWQLEPNPELPGGRVIITIGPGFPSDKLYQRVADLSRQNGNEPVDMLFCVPHILVDRADGPYPCAPARMFAEKGRRVWDGTRAEGRKIPIVDNALHRFVQYESCRGLEGWVTFLYALDVFYDSKLIEFRDAIPAGEPLSERRQRMWAAEWLMIPLTRCINTLVIHLDRRDSVVGRLLLETAAKFSDFIEVEDPGSTE